MSGTSPGLSAERLDELAAAVRRHSDLEPELGIVLGSGLGGLAEQLGDATAVPFSDLPGWPQATAPGHAGRLLLGHLEGVPVVCQQGRLHLYEGNSAKLVVEPVLLMGRLGARRVLLTNAAGGVNVRFPAGTLMLVTDHINLTGHHPLIGPNEDRLGERFPDMVDAWSPGLRAVMRRAAIEAEVPVEEGVYIGLTGPSYETPAEVQMLRMLGADAVGMSTVLEAIAARWTGLELVGVSLVTNPGAGVTGEPLTHEEVLEAARAAGPQFIRLVRRFARLLGENRDSEGVSSDARRKAVASHGDGGGLGETET
jgi:purine-nucleoside phosphorylase